MPKVLDIVMVGQSNESGILRRKARALMHEEIFKQETQDLIDDMIETCGSTAVGLSAPQVGHSIRLFIVAPQPRVSFPGSVYEEPTVVINPLVLVRSDEMADGWDGCMSIKNDRGHPRAWFKRHKTVKVHFLDRRGDWHIKSFEGFAARIFQHEFDHLEGVLFTDYVDVKDLVQQNNFNKMMEQQS